MASDDFYPPGPSTLPADLTRPAGAYRLRVLAMIAGLFAFVLLYLAFVALAGMVAYWLLMLPVGSGKGQAVFFLLMLKFGGAFAAILLWLFLFRGLFKRQRVERATHIKLDEKEHPALFAFIRRVYEDVGAPPPRNVVVSPEVNAALIYDTSLVNLVIPPKKDLLIGLGLVNVVNLSEFKAVLAHEFGHFSQRSVGLGSYLYVANRVLYDLIYSRDRLDRFVGAWCAQDLRISFPAWALKAVLWTARKILGFAYQGLNLVYLSLSRQMEFNADNVAVSVTGSDALIHGLARLEFANECLVDAARGLNVAADHGLMTDDLFFHQQRSAERLRRLQKKPQAGLPPELPSDPAQQVQVFEPVDDGIPDRYRSHPTDHMRERNAKRMYIRSAIDERSPWLLFHRPEALRRRMTELFYRQMLDRSEKYEPRPAAEVQAFLDAEHAETPFDPKYHAFYDDRFVNPGDLELPLDGPWPRERLASWFASWPREELKAKMEAYNGKMSELQILQGLHTGELKPKGKTFPFRDQQYSLKDVERLMQMVDGELEADLKQLHEIDREVLIAHWSLALRLDEARKTGGRWTEELLERYRFHLSLQGLLQRMLGEQNRLNAVLNFLTNNQQLSQEDFQEVRGALESIRRAAEECQEEARGLRTPALTNVPKGSSLYSLIVDRDERPLPPIAEQEVSGEWISRLANRCEAVLGRVRRVHFKSLGSLLAFQEQLVGQCTPQKPPATETAEAPAAQPAVGPSAAAKPAVAKPPITPSAGAKPPTAKPAVTKPPGAKPPVKSAAVDPPAARPPSG